MTRMAGPATKGRRSDPGGSPDGAKAPRDGAETATTGVGASAAAPASPPMAMVRITLHSLEEGDAEIEVAIDPNGELGAAWGEGEDRLDAYDLLLDALIRELEGAFGVLAEA